LTRPTITYEVGEQDDLGDSSDYSETEDGASATLTVDNGTIFNILVSAAVENKIVYYEIDITDVDGTIYTKGIVGYKTSSTSIKAKVEFVFDDATTEVVMAESSSTDWTTASWTQSASKTVDKVRLYATSATGNVYYDFWSIYKGTQTFQNFNVLRGPEVEMKKAILSIPGSDTDVTQMLGIKNCPILIEGPMRTGKTWGGSNLTYGEFLMKLAKDRHFQWFTSDLGNFKVTPTRYYPIQSKNNNYQVQYHLELETYDVGDASGFGNPAWYGK